MSNCYDHSYKKNMLDSVYGTRKELKNDMEENRRELTSWYYKQMRMYDYAFSNFSEWYKEYAGDSWEELNGEENK